MTTTHEITRRGKPENRLLALVVYLRIMGMGQGLAKGLDREKRPGFGCCGGSTSKKWVCHSPASKGGERLANK